jgi:hypothetical protein
VQEDVGFSKADAGAIDAVGDALDKFARGREGLAVDELAGVLVKGGDIRECSADIGCEPCSQAYALRFLGFSAQVVD